MSDEEEVVVSEEEVMETSGPSEAELAMKREEAIEKYSSLAEDDQELLANNAVERAKLGAWIEASRKHSERRKKEREAEEKRLAAKRAEEEAERKAAEEERRRKKEADELERKAKKLEKMAELERLKNPSRPNFVITKKEGPVVAEESTSGEPKKSREQLEAEKQAILKQRIPALDIDGADGAKLKSKANELHALIVRLESEKYDLEKRFKSQQLDMMELAEKARSIHKVGRGGDIKRVQLASDEVDKVQEKFAGCPSKVIMFSEFERQKDKRTYDDKRVNFTGPIFSDPVPKISPKRIVKWDENTGLPKYEFVEGYTPAEEEEEEE